MKSEKGFRRFDAFIDNATEYLEGKRASSTLRKGLLYSFILWFAHKVLSLLGGKS